jgi:hypothetical protein
VNPASRGETPAASRPPLKRFPDGLGRFRSCAVAQIKLDPDECFVAYEHS